VAWPDDGEVAMVEAGHLGQSEPLAHGDHRGVGGAQRQALVGKYELGGTPIIVTGELDGLQGPVGQRGQELRFDLCSALAREQIADLGDDAAGHENPPPGQMQCGEQVNAFAVVGVVLDRGGYERSCVADDHGQRPKPSASSSPARVEVSDRPDVTAPNHGGGHAGVSAPPANRCTSASAAGTCSSGS
jgi:hypothetical protein